MGPFVSPASVTRQLIGVPDLMVAKRLTAVAKKLLYKNLVLVASEDGLDEVSLCTNTHIFVIQEKNSKQSIIRPESFGFTRVTPEALLGGTIEENAQIIRDILAGEKGPKRDVVILNAAVALLAAEKVTEIADGIELAAAAIDSGNATKALANLVKETQQYAK